jgi:hypothetical protein
MGMMGVRCRGKRRLQSWRETSEVFVLGSWIGCFDILKITTLCMDPMESVHLSKIRCGRHDRLD